MAFAVTRVTNLGKDDDGLSPAGETRLAVSDVAYLPMAAAVSAGPTRGVQLVMHPAVRGVDR